MSHRLLLLLPALFLFCTQPATEKPTLPDEKLARIMADLSVAEAATNGLSGYPKDSLMQVYYAQVFDMHGTTVEAYEKDLRIIGDDLPRLQSIVQQSLKLLDGGEMKPKL